MPRNQSIGDVEIGILIDGQKFSATLKRVEKDTERATKKMEMNAKKVGKGFNFASGGVTGLAARIRTLAAAGGLTALVSSARKFSEYIRQSAEEMSNLVNNAKAAGLELQRFEALQGLTETYGFNVNQLTNLFDKIRVRQGEAADGMERYAQAFRRLGVDIYTSQGTFKEAETIFYEIADALKRMGANSTVVRQAMYRLFEGRVSRSALSFWSQGSALIKDQLQSWEDITIQQRTALRYAQAQHDLALQERDHRNRIKELFEDSIPLQEEFVGFFQFSLEKLLTPWAERLAVITRLLGLDKEYARDLARDLKKAVEASELPGKTEALARLDVIIASDDPTVFMDALEQLRYHLNNLPTPTDNARIALSKLNKEADRLHDEAVKQANETLANMDMNLRITGHSINEVADMATNAADKFGNLNKVIANIRLDTMRDRYADFREDIRTLVQEGFSDEMIRHLYEYGAVEGVADYLNRQGEELDKLNDSWIEVGRSASDALRQMVIYGASANEVISRLLKTLAISFAQQGLKDLIGERTGGFWNALRGLAGLQYGGPAYAGNAYIVGEAGPELFVPKQSGTVVPNNKMGTQGSSNVTVNLNLPADVTAAQVRQIAQDEIIPQAIMAGREAGMQVNLRTQGF